VTAGRYLDALARAADWTGSDPGLPARPRPRSRFEPGPDDDGPSWLLGLDDEAPSGVPDGTRALGGAGPDTGEAGRDGAGTDRAPVWPAPPRPVAVAASTAVARPFEVLPVRIGTADAEHRSRAVDPAPPGPAAGDVVPAAAPEPPRAPEPEWDATVRTTAAPPSKAPVRAVHVPGDDADLADHRRPGEPDDDRRRPDRDPRGDDPGDEPPPRPRATARPAAPGVIDDPLARTAGPADSAAPPPPVVIEIGRIEVRITADGPSAPSGTAAPSRSALPPPGPTLADYLDGLAVAAGRRP
jgi:hypothetical protein